MDDETKVLNEQSSEILKNQGEILNAIGTSKRKDCWDKFAILSSFISGVILVSIGGIFTVYFAKEESSRENHRVRLHEMDSISKLLPQLLGKDENQKKIALEILAISTDLETALDIAELIPGAGSLAVLSQVSKSSDSSNTNVESARTTLEQIDFTKREVRVQQTKEGTIESLRVKVAVHAIHEKYSLITVVNLDTNEAFSNFPGSGGALAEGDSAILEREGYSALILSMTDIIIANGNDSSANYVFGWQGLEYIIPE